MKVELTTPAALEGAWSFLDETGKVIATSTSHPGAALHITPYFYKGQLSQTLVTARTEGAKGKVRQQSLRIAAASGKMAAFEADIAKPIVPKFDRESPPKQNGGKS